jgi:hypothetical protein
MAIITFTTLRQKMRLTVAVRFPAPGILGVPEELTGAILVEIPVKEE